MKPNSELRNYIEKNIIQKYQYFDKGHDINHVQAVIFRSLKYFKKLNKKYSLNINMVYTIAAYHDYGMIISRERHSYHSEQLVLHDENLKKWFKEDEIKTIAEACEEHSTSINVVPKTIYGKIVADADKDTNINIGIMRGWQFAYKNFPNLSFDEKILEIHKEIVKRFGDENIGGENLVKYYILDKKNKRFIKKMVYYANNKEAFEVKIKKLLKKEKFYKNVEYKTRTN